jgi:5-formyltetrahydrofolate cyclo-ligase
LRFYVLFEAWVADKTSLRKSYLYQRSQLSKDIQHQAAVQASDVFLCDIPVSKHDIIAGYYPIRDELSTLPLLEKLHSLGCQLALPCVTEKDNPLVFRSWRLDTILEPHPHYPVKQPKNDSRLVTPTIILVPLLAFDKKGYRLGYGGGFYDRTLAALLQQGIKIRAVGYGYSFQCAENFPVSEHDQALNAIVTEKECFTF